MIEMKKKLSLLLAQALLLALCAGCGNTSESVVSGIPAQETQTVQSDHTVPEAVQESVSDAEPSSAEAMPEIPNKLPESYPMLSEEGMTLTALQSTNPNLQDLITDYGDLPWWQWLTERTGINFEWQMASFASMEEQFNLLIAANDLCNINMTGMYYNDGITNAVENDIFVDIAPYLDEYAPDYKAITMQDRVRPVVYDENGSMIAFYEIGMEEFTPNNGVIIRGDLLEAQGLDVPVTYDQYEEALTKLKDAYNIPGPIYIYPDNTRWLSSGKNVQMGFSLGENGEAVYGPVEDGFREYLKIINRWYANGLIYKDFYVIPDGQNINYMISQMSSGDSIATFGYCEFANMIALDEGQELVAGYIPRDNEEDTVHLTEGIDSIVGVAKSYYVGPNSTEEEVQAICMLMNYFYTEEGSLFANYGVEGETYKLREDGTPWYTDIIINNPDGLTQTQALCFYVGYMVPAYADYTKYNISTLTTWADFVEAWGAADNTLNMPQVSLNRQEQEVYSAAASDVDTYMDENIIRFIIGELDPNDDATWESYISDMERLGVRDMIEVYQAALDRFNAA